MRTATVRAIRISGLTAVAAALLAVPIRAGVLESIGYTQLAQQLGDALPTGAAVGVSQVEASVGGAYAPNTSRSEFSGKTFAFRSGASGTSSHADGMAQRIYGNSQSTAPGVAEIDLWDAADWLGSGFLRTGTAQPPAVETRAVQNHSWIGSMNTPDLSVDALRRLDYAIDRDGFTAVVGMNNGDSTTLPELLGQSYNTIAVGRSDGKHSHGTTVLDGSGRIKPDLVVPEGTTSAATARVSSAAALLIDQAGSTAAAAPAAIKALLLAGATKEEFSGTWQNSTSQPLDFVYGAGELNIYRSSTILAAGRQGANGPSPVGLIGWDVAQTTPEGQVYQFEVPNGRVLTEWSAVLDWNRTFDGGTGYRFVPDPTLADLDLLLRAADGPRAGEVLSRSASPVDNVEHIYRNSALETGGGALGPGRYTLEVAADRQGVAYGLAWFGNLDVVLGDLDFNGMVDFDDIDEMVLGLSAASLYEAAFGVPPEDAGDTDQDGDLDFDDIDAFVGLLVESVGLAAVATVPEPAGGALLAAAALLLTARRLAPGGPQCAWPTACRIDRSSYSSRSNEK